MNKKVKAVEECDVLEVNPYFSLEINFEKDRAGGILLFPSVEIISNGKIIEKCNFDASLTLRWDRWGEVGLPQTITLEKLISDEKIKRLEVIGKNIGRMLLDDCDLRILDGYITVLIKTGQGVYSSSVSAKLEALKPGPDSEDDEGGLSERQLAFIDYLSEHDD